MEIIKEFMQLKTFILIFLLISLFATIYDFSIFKLILLFSATGLGFLQAYQFYGTTTKYQIVGGKKNEK